MGGEVSTLERVAKSQIPSPGLKLNSPHIAVAKAQIPSPGLKPAHGDRHPARSGVAKAQIPSPGLIEINAKDPP